MNKLKKFFCKHYFINDMVDYQMSMTCTKCGYITVLSATPYTPMDIPPNKENRK